MKVKTLLDIVAHNYGKEGRRRGEEKETENRDSSLIQTRSLYKQEIIQIKKIIKAGSSNTSL